MVGARSASRAAPPAAALALALLLLLSPAAAVFPEQAGQVDWLKQHVGVVTHAAHGRGAGPGEPLVLVGGAAAVVAALRPGDGTVAWRRVFDETEAVQRLAAAGAVALAVTGGATPALRALGPGGALLWEEPLAGMAPDVAVVRIGGRSHVAVADVGVVRLLEVASGRLAWAAPAAVASPQHSAAAVAAGDDGELVAAFALGLELVSARLRLDGSVVARAAARAAAPLGAAVAALPGGAVLALAADGSRVCAGAAASGALQCLSLGRTGPADFAAGGGCPAHAVVQYGGAGGGALVRVDAAGAAVVRRFPAGTALSECSLDGDGRPVVAAASAPADGGLTVETVDAADGAALASASAPALRRATVDGAPLGPRLLALGGALVQLEEGTLAMLGGAVGGAGAELPVVWARAEALAEVEDLLWADLPAPTAANEAEWAAAQPGFAATVRMEVAALRRQLGLASPAELAALAAHRAATSDALRPTRDPDGFRRQLLLATRGGKVAALHNGDGRTLWEADLGPAPVAAGGGGRAARRLAHWRVPHDATHDAEVAVFTVGAAETTAVVLNARTGAVVRRLAAPGPAADVFALPPPAAAAAAGGPATEQRVFAAAPAARGGRLSLFPDDGDARAALAAAAPALAFWRLDDGFLRGFGAGADGAVAERWALALAPSGRGRAVLALAARDAGEAVASPARVLGTGEVRLKHLAPGTLLAAVGPPPGAPPGRLTLLVLDAASGRVLHSQEHAAARGPVAAAASEHWAAAHFWDGALARWRVVSIDLYEAAPPRVSVPELALGVGGGGAPPPATAWAPPRLEARTASFLTRLPAGVLAPSQTARGVAAKQLLFGTPAGRVVAIDRRLVDARRPLLPPPPPGARPGRPPAAAAAEGLPPYAAELPLPPTAHATLAHRVARLARLAPHPAALESACLLAAAGLDLFVTRLAPSRAFDMVPPDFPYAALVGVVAAMAAAAAAARGAVARRALALKWA